MVTFAVPRPRRGIFRTVRAVMCVAALFGTTWMLQAWVTPGRSAARGRRVVRGAKSQELMDQLADDMDELMRLLQEGKAEEEDDSHDSTLDGDAADGDAVDGDAADGLTEAHVETDSEAALMTLDTEAARTISCLDLSGLQRVPGSDEYIVTAGQLQSIVESKVQQYTAVIKGCEKYITELEEELESTETQLEEKDATLQVETERRRERSDETF
eukprot:Skav211000  [mRNA]  locus=scaffold4287:13980:17668:+ [translate_table: standard]